ncbi:DUF3427 domain-containing protein [Larkinella bovis]|uniref:DUF3427 domain-containing protein n=1 Tax=Larkinella bovis TaxID=683041 RepID=A0ABW0I7Z8_9BACT
MNNLQLFEEYNRKEVHSIFSPHTVFTPQSGTWGLQGIVSIPNRPGDFVFFVTFGQQQGEHTFDEGITEFGVLSWQSQPSQNLTSSQILQFINHDELKNVIYLFLRTSKKGSYNYLGRLKYISHDFEREKPVYFQWQLLDWPIPTELIIKMNLSLTKFKEDYYVIDKQINILSEPNIQQFQKTAGVVTKTFRGRKTPDYSIIDAKNKELGLEGEIFIVQFEKNLLEKVGRIDLADKVRHISLIEGDGAGYDILSFLPSGEEKFIEVKTTQGPLKTVLYMSMNELDFSRIHSSKYYLYRVFNFNLSEKTGGVEIFKNINEDIFEFTPIQYRLKFK